MEAAEIFTWIELNYQLLILAVLIVILLCMGKIKKFIQKHRNSKKNEPTKRAFFDQNESISQSMQRQLEMLESEISQVNDEGSKIFEEESQLMGYYKENRERLTAEKNRLGERYTILKKQMDATTKMIDNQRKLEKQMVD